MGSVGLASGQVQFGAATAGGSGGAYSPDNTQAWSDAFGAASAFDCEFDRTGNPTTVPASWLYQNQNSATYLEQLGAGKSSIAAGFNDLNKLTCLVQPVSAAGSYTLSAKIIPTFNPATDFSPGTCITDGTKAMMIWNTADLMIVSRWSNITSTYVDNIATVGSAGRAGQAPYMRIKKNSASSYDFQFSFDAINWTNITAAYDVSAFMTPTHFGFGFRQPAGACVYAVDWFRVR